VSMFPLACCSHACRAAAAIAQRRSCSYIEICSPPPVMLLQANSEVSALLGRIPSAVGYQPTLATDLGTLQERITSTHKGSITSVQVSPLTC
jgi:hypothetical protein